MYYGIEANKYLPVDRNDTAPCGSYWQIDFDNLPVKQIKGYSFSDKYIIGWTENICYLYEPETSSTKLLSFQLDHLDAH